MPQNTDKKIRGGRLTTGDIPLSEPAKTKAEELARRWVLNAAAIQPEVSEALGAICGVTTWLLSHLGDLDRRVVLDALVQSIHMANTGQVGLIVPAADAAVDGRSAAAKPLQDQ